MSLAPPLPTRLPRCLIEGSHTQEKMCAYGF